MNRTQVLTTTATLPVVAMATALALPLAGSLQLRPLLIGVGLLLTLAGTVLTAVTLRQMSQPRSRARRD